MDEDHVPVSGPLALPVRVFDVPGVWTDAVRYDRLVCNEAKICSFVLDPSSNRREAHIRQIECGADTPNADESPQVAETEHGTHRELYKPFRDIESASPLIHVDPAASLLRIGSNIFATDDPTNCWRFTSHQAGRSLSVDSVTKWGSQIVITSREAVTRKAFFAAVPPVESHGAVQDAALVGRAETGENDRSSLVNRDNRTDCTKASTIQSEEPPVKHDSSDSDISGSDEDISDSSDTDDFSAAESWSDGSSEYDMEEIAEDAAPLYTSFIPPEKKALGEKAKSTGDGDSDADSEEDDASSDSSESDSDDDNLIGFAKEVDESDWENEMLFDCSDEVSNSDDDGRGKPPGFWDEYDGQHDDNVTDSEPENGDALGSKPKGKKKPPKQIKSEPVAQLDVYDCSTESKPRIFHFARRYRQMINSSGPVVHPFKPLIVWPIGDKLMLFADFKYNTYFWRKFRPSQPGSEQVYIEARFANNGEHLHIATLERRQTSPKKGAEAASGPLYDLLISTYRLSARKTSRSPPSLIYRVKLQLGSLEKPSVALTWRDSEAFVSCSAKRLTVFRVKLFRPQTADQQTILVPKNLIELPDSAINRAVHFVPMKHKDEEVQSTAAETYAVIIVAPEPAPISEEKADPKPVAKAEDKKDESGAAPTEDNSEANEQKDDEKAKADPEGKPIESETRTEEKDAADEGKLEEPPRVILFEDHPSDSYAVFVNEEDLGGWIAADASVDQKIADGMGVGQFDMEVAKIDRDDDCC